MDDVKPQLPSFVSENIGSAARFALAALAGILVKQGILTDDQSANFIQVGVGLAIGAATAGWVWWKNRQSAKAKVAAAATGNPNADPADPSSKLAVAQAIASPASPIVAKGT